MESFPHRGHLPRMCSNCRLSWRSAVSAWHRCTIPCESMFLFRIFVDETPSHNLSISRQIWQISRLVAVNLILDIGILMMILLRRVWESEKRDWKHMKCKQKHIKRNLPSCICCCFLWQWLWPSPFFDNNKNKWKAINQSIICFLF